jgi:dUTP pyrophosphatase
MSEELDNFDENELSELLKMLDEINIDQTEEPNYDAIIETFGLNINELESEMESYTPTINLPFSKSNSDAVNPNYAYETDSGFDLYSTEEIWIFGFDRVLIPTGLHMDIPEGYEIQVRSKSGLALKQGLMVLNSPGTVDQGYTGEIQVIMFNTTKNKIKIEKGQKIAQAVLCPVVSGKWITLVEKKEINEKDRNANGFGSTGLV